jgi:hypothetical protein
VKAALTHGADPNTRNWLDFTPLMWAAACGDRQIVDTLLAHGAKLDASSIYGSALSFAALGRHENIALYLLDRGIGPDPWRADGATPLMVAAANGHTSLIEALLRKKHDANKTDGDGATALIYAARLGQAGSVRSLLKAAADLNIADSHGRTALMDAAANGFPIVVDLLLARRRSMPGTSRAPPPCSWPRATTATNRSSAASLRAAPTPRPETPTARHPWCSLSRAGSRRPPPLCARPVCRLPSSRSRPALR